jgi:ABC-type enterochelin transport system substrate-binding protein
MKRYLTLMALAMFPIFASCEPKEETEKAAAAAPGEAAGPTTTEKAPKVRLKTSMGEIVLELNAEKAPISVENFLGLREKEALRQYRVSPGDAQFHDPGWRFHQWSTAR